MLTTILSLSFVLAQPALDEARSRLTEAERLRDRRQFAAALSAAERALAAARKAVPKGESDLLPFLDLAADLAGTRYEDARADQLYSEALAIRRKHPSAELLDRTRMVINLFELARCREGQGDYGTAEPLYREALTEMEKLQGKNERYASLLRELGDLYRYMGDARRAESTLKEALGLTLKSVGEKHQDHARVLASLGYLYKFKREYTDAEEHFSRALAIARALPKEEGFEYDNIRTGLASVYREFRKYDKAEALYQEAVENYRNRYGEDHPSYASALHSYGMLMDEMGRSEEAGRALRRAVEIKKARFGDRHPAYATSLQELAGVYENRGQHERAEPLLRQCVEIKRDMLTLNLAANSERQTLALLKELNHHLSIYLSLIVRAGMPAEFAYDQVLAWKGTVFARQRRLRLERNHPATADDLRRLRALASELGRVVQEGPQGNNVEAWGRKVEELTQRKDDLEAKIASLIPPTNRRTSLEEVRKALPPKTVLIDLFEFDFMIPPKNGKGPWKDDRRVAAFIVKRDGPLALVMLGEHTSLEGSVNAYRRELTGEKLERLELKHLPSECMKRDAWEPLEPHVRGAEAVLISPDGVLAQCPFAALPGSKPGTYLIEDYAIAIIPVPQLLPDWLQRREVKGDGSLLVLGGVDYGAAPGATPAKTLETHVALRGDRATAFTALPGTEQESDAVAQAFRKAMPSGVVERIEKEGATESAFRDNAPGKRYLHLATHGFFSPAKGITWTLRSNPGTSARTPVRVLPSLEDTIRAGHPGLLSGIVMAGANRGPGSGGASQTDDGILTALEVAELDLRQSELVVLSACETGLGEAAGGEGLLGLQRAFQVSGAQSVVASLWKVDDEATRLLMAHFYDNLWRKKMGRLQALRQAQLSVLNNEVRTGADRGGLGSVEKGTEPAARTRTSPRLWAAWVLSGDPGDLTIAEPPPSVHVSMPILKSSPKEEEVTIIPWKSLIAAGMLMALGLCLVAWYMTRKNSGNAL